MSKKTTETVTVTEGGTIPLANYANAKIEVTIEREITFENDAERATVMAGMHIEAAKSCGIQLANILRPTEGVIMQQAIKALVPTQHQKVILSNPLAVHYLRLVTGDFPASALVLEEREFLGVDDMGRAFYTSSKPATTKRRIPAGDLPTDHEDYIDPRPSPDDSDDFLPLAQDGWDGKDDKDELIPTDDETDPRPSSDNYPHDFDEYGVHDD